MSKACSFFSAFILHVSLYIFTTHALGLKTCLTQPKLLFFSNIYRPTVNQRQRCNFISPLRWPNPLYAWIFKKKNSPDVLLLELNELLRKIYLFRSPASDTHIYIYIYIYIVIYYVHKCVYVCVCVCVCVRAGLLGFCGVVEKVTSRSASL